MLRRYKYILPSDDMIHMHHAFALDATRVKWHEVVFLHPLPLTGP